MRVVNNVNLYRRLVKHLDTPPADVLFTDPFRNVLQQNRILGRGDCRLLQFVNTLVDKFFDKNTRKKQDKRRYRIQNCRLLNCLLSRYFQIDDHKPQKLITMLHTILRYHKVKRSTRNQQYDRNQYDKVLVDLIEQRIPNPQLNKLFRIHTKLKLFGVDDVLTTWTNSQAISAFGDLTDTLSLGVILGLWEAGRVFIGVKAWFHGHIRSPTDINRQHFLIIP